MSQGVFDFVYTNNHFDLYTNSLIPEQLSSMNAEVSYEGNKKL